MSLSGVYFDVRANPPCFVASDGPRIALSDCDSLIQKSKEGGVDGFIVSKETCLNVSNVFAVSPSVQIGINGTTVIFDDGETIVSGRLVEAEFAKYEKVIPVGDDLKVLKYNTREFKRVLRALYPLADDTTLRVVLNVKEDATQVSCGSDGNDAASDSLACGNEGKVNGMIAFNIQSLMQALKPVSADEFEVKIKDGKSMVLLEAHNDENYRHLLMPMIVK